MSQPIVVTSAHHRRHVNGKQHEDQECAIVAMARSIIGKPKDTVFHWLTAKWHRRGRRPYGARR